MSDRPILFSAPMVRAILREIEQPGTGKTQTRRIIPAGNVYDDISSEGAEDFELRGWTVFEHGQALCAAKPKYVIGDRLWVRERTERANGEAVGYPVDGTWLPNTPWEWQRASLPSIYMPRRLSRLTLHVTDVRVERLQDISEEDAIAEGVEYDSDGWRDYLMPTTQCCASAKDSYRTLWDSINGEKHPWTSNPWIVAVTFRPILGNIDLIGSAS